MVIVLLVANHAKIGDNNSYLYLLLGSLLQSLIHNIAMAAALIQLGTVNV